MQGSQGAGEGQEFYIENVIEELDAPREFFYDSETTTLYYATNSTGDQPPSGTFSAVVAQAVQPHAAVSR